MIAAAALCILSCAAPGFLRANDTPPQSTTGTLLGRVSVASSQGGMTNNLAAIDVKLTGPSPATTSQDALSDNDGRFEFDRLVPGNYTLAITVDGFKPWTANVTVSAGQPTVQDAGLQLNLVEENVEVKGEAVEVATESVSATATVSDQQLATLPLRTGKFTEALSVSPSVIKTQEGRLNFNGQAESQGMLLVDSAENVDPVAGSFAIPMPVDAIQSIQVFNTPDSVAYGGFSAGLTRIDIKPPSPLWNYKLLDFLPSFRGKNDHLVGVANITPRFEVGGPLIKDKLNFSQYVSYEFRRDPIAGTNLAVQRNVRICLRFLQQSAMDCFAQAPDGLQSESFSVHQQFCQYQHANSAVGIRGFPAARRIVRPFRRVPVRFRHGSDHRGAVHEILYRCPRPGRPGDDHQS